MTIKDLCELLKGKEDYQVILRGDNSDEQNLNKV